MTLVAKVHRAKAMVFLLAGMAERVGPERSLSAKELMPLNCGAGEGS